MNTPFLLQWRVATDGGGWHTRECAGIPVLYPVIVRIDFTPAGDQQNQLATDLIQEVLRIIEKVHGTISADTVTTNPVEPAPDDGLLEVVVSDGKTPFGQQARWQEILDEHRRQSWLLPMMPAPPAGSPAVLPASMQEQNVAFWRDSIKEMALTVIARAGVTSLERRVFVSYRRVDTEPIANQIRDELSRHNFEVFLDTISVDPGINFQARLFEQLSDKSMVVMLHSKTFARSRWTMEEFTYVKEHDLSLLILRMPDLLPDDPLENQYRAGDVLRLAAGDLTAAAANATPLLTEAALANIVSQIIEHHDLEMIERLAALRLRTLKALEAAQVKSCQSLHNASIQADSDVAGKTYRLFPVSRPPGLPELFNASTFVREPGERRIVIGNISAFNEDRVKQMDWTVNERNVSYMDVSMLDTLVQEIKLGLL